MVGYFTFRSVSWLLEQYRGNILSLYRSLMNVGCPERAPVTEEPDSNSTLPMEDKLWDTGVTTTANLPGSSIGLVGDEFTDNCYRKLSQVGLQIYHHFQQEPWVALH